MSVVTLSRGGRAAIPKMKQALYVGGVLRKDIEILGGAVSQGLGGARLSCLMPAATFDAEASSLYGAEVVAYAWHDGETMGPPIFRGLVDSIDGSLAVGDDTLGFVCRSWLHYLDKVQIGQKVLAGQVNFRRYDWTTATERRWTVRSMVQEAFDAGYWPNDWGTVLALGDTSALVSGSATQELATDVLFTAGNYREFLATMLGLAGDIGVRERFTASLTYLDFYRLGPQSGVAREFRVAALGDDVGDSAVNVLALEHGRDLGDMATRVIGYGAPKMMIVTIGEDDPVAPLVPDWLDATAVGDTPTATEQAVLDDPDSAVPGSPTFDVARMHVFRRYRIPAALRNYTMLDRLPVEDATGRPLAPHAHLFEYDLEPGTSGGANAWVPDGERDTATLQDIETFDPDRGSVVLKRPAVRLALMKPTGDIPEATWERTEVYLTCAFALEGRECGYDTGHRPTINVEGLEDDGLTMTFSRPDLRYVQYTSFGLGVVDTDGSTAIEYNALVWDGGAWTEYASATVERDDRPTIARIAEAALRSRSRLRNTFAVTCDYFTQGVKIGDTIRVNNGGTLLAPVQVQSVSFTCSADAATRFVATDAIPEAAVIEDPAGMAGRSSRGRQMAADFARQQKRRADGMGVPNPRGTGDMAAWPQVPDPFTANNIPPPTGSTSWQQGPIPTIARPAVRSD